MHLANKCIVVTGGGGGLGKAIITALLAQKAQIVAIDKNANILAPLTKIHPTIATYALNISDESQVIKAMQTIQDRFGAIHGLINNAGITRDGLLLQGKNENIDTLSLSQFNEVLNVNTIGSFLCAREVAKHMVQQHILGVIVNISSISRAGNVGQSNYAASKAAVAAMSSTWAKELGGYGIRCASVAPGFIDTQMTRVIPEAIIEKITALVPLKRMGKAEEVADAVQFILQNEYFNGKVLELDGGLTL